MSSRAPTPSSIGKRVARRSSSMPCRFAGSATAMRSTSFSNEYGIATTRSRTCIWMFCTAALSTPVIPRSTSGRRWRAARTWQYLAGGDVSSTSAAASGRLLGAASASASLSGRASWQRAGRRRARPRHSRRSPVESGEATNRLGPVVARRGIGSASPRHDNRGTVTCDPRTSTAAAAQRLGPDHSPECRCAWKSSNEAAWRPP